MSITEEHGRIAIAIIATVTMCTIIIQCKFSPQCEEVNRWTIYMLLLLIGTMVGREIIDIPGHGGGGA